MEPRAIPQDLPEILRYLYESALAYPGSDPVPQDQKIAIAMRNAFDLGRTMVPDATVAGVQTGWDKYEELRATLEGLPATWYPALISTMVKAAYSRPVFVPGGASRLVSNVEGRIGHAAAPVPDGEGPMTAVHINHGTGRNEYPVHRDVRALIDGLTGSIQILRESVNRERATRINPEIARKALPLIEIAERETQRIVQDGSDFRLSIPARPGHDSDLMISAGLEAGRKLAEAMLTQAAAARGPSRVTAAELESVVAEAAGTAILERPAADTRSQHVAETADQPMDATDLILLGMVGIETIIGSLASRHPEETGPALDKIQKIAREVRIAMTGKG